MLHTAATKIIITLTAGLFLAACTHEAPGISDTTATPSATIAITPEQLDPISGSINDLLAKNQPMECDFETDAQGSSISGTVHVANNRFHVDSTVESEADDSKVDVFAIGHEDYIYQWSSLTYQGYQITPEALEEAKEKLEGVIDSSDSQAAILNLLNQTDYTCRTWQPNDQVFELPEDIRFTDLTPLVENL